jgi:hypothetical protein
MSRMTIQIQMMLVGIYSGINQKAMLRASISILKIKVKGVILIA